MKGVIEIPEDGMKVVTIVGYVNGSPIWRDVGRLVITTSGKPSVLIDRTFNPAGPVIDSDSMYLMCPVRHFTEEEIQVKSKWKKGNSSAPLPPSGKYSSFDDMDDDIPF